MLRTVSFMSSGPTDKSSLKKKVLAGAYSTSAPLSCQLTFCFDQISLKNIYVSFQQCDQIA